ncbi:hypothetical protein BGZ65_001265, partial [Modicella reniformis]
MTNSLQPQVPTEIEVEPLLEDTSIEHEAHIHSTAQDSEFDPMSMASEAERDNEDELAWFAELARRPWYLRPSMLWLNPLLFAFGVIVGVIESPMQQLIIQIICKEYLLQHDPQEAIEYAGIVLPDNRCKTPEVLAVAALVGSRIHAIKGVITLFTLAKWTALSDILGRKALLQLALIALSISQSIIWFTASPRNPFGYRLLYVDGVLLGLTAGGSLLDPAIAAYVGPSLGGYVVKTTGDLTSVIRISLTSFVIVFAYLIAMPESLRKRTISQVPERAGDKYTTSIKRISFLVSIWDATIRGVLSILDPLLVFVPGFAPISSKAPSRYTFTLIVIATHLVRISGSGISILFIPLTNLVFKWGSYEDGLFFSYSGLCSFIVYLGIFPLLQFLYKRYMTKHGKPGLHTYSRVEQMDPEREGSFEMFNMDERPTAATPFSDTDTRITLKMDAFFFLGGTILFGISFLIGPFFMSVPSLYV